MYRSMWLMAMLVVSTAFVSCSKDDGGDPDDPNNGGTPPSFNLNFVKIPAGTFIMGSPTTEANRHTNERQHKVILTKDFRLSKYPITNAQYAIFLNAVGIGESGEGEVTYLGRDGKPTTEIRRFIVGRRWGVDWDNGKWVAQTSYKNHPVVYVTWYGAKAFADYIGGSLPTEAQWEYACRAGTTTVYSYGDTEDGDYMWYSANSGNGETKAVGTKKPNLWGVYDMHGNVFEWCADWYTSYSEGTVIDPIGPPNSTSRILRGGSCYSDAQYCRSASRDSKYDAPDKLINYWSNVGFRVAIVP